MFVINIAEWCVELLVLAMAFLIASCGTFVLMMIVSVAWHAWSTSKLFKWIHKQ